MISEPVSVMPRRFAWLLSLCLVLALALNGRALAQANNERAYKELIEQALSEFKLKNWPEARVLFRQAHELSPNARTLRGIGLVSYEMRDYPQAVQQLSAALVDTRQPLNEAQRSECETLLARARTFVGSYRLSLTPAEAQVTLDGGALVRDQDGQLLVPFGEHVLRATADGYQDSTLRLRVQGGERSELNVTLQPATVAQVASPSPVPHDDVPAEEPPTAAQSPAATSVASSAEPKSSRRWGKGLRYTWVAASAAAVFGAGAAAAWYVGQGKVDDLRDRCDKRADRGDPCVRGETDTATIERYERLTNASLGLAAAGLVTAGVLFYFEWPRERDLSLSVGLQNLSLHGKF